MNNDLVLYVHGKGGSSLESEYYNHLFPNSDVVGLDYWSQTPWGASKEIRDDVVGKASKYERITLIANSIGAFFCMNAGIDALVHQAYFISPIVDMERLILDMLAWSNASEEELQKRGVIPTSFGEDLSWDYLCYVREHPVEWRAPTEILYGRRDNLTSYEAIAKFATEHNARLTVMEDGEHWFHTEEQMKFVDAWIRG